MSNITTTYPCTAPFIREAALRAASSLEHERTIRSRMEKRGQLFAYAHALDILMSSPEGKLQPPEVANMKTIPNGFVHFWR